MENNNTQPTIIINNVNSNTTTPQKTRKKIVSILLCLFLGGVGAHKLYEGKTGLFVLYLLFCWTLIPLGLSLIDFICLLFKPNEY